MRQISGNKLLVKALKEEGVTTLFGYPGACTIDISDELYRQSGIDIILPRHEQALVHEADAYARTTGKVGVCLVTSGPGATNLVTGLATANYDSVPLVCFTGQVARHLIGNDAFQEVDIVGKEHSQQAVALLGEKKEYEAMQNILKEIAPDRETTEKMLETAQSSGDSRWVSILMNELGRHGRKQRKAFEL